MLIKNVNDLETILNSKIIKALEKTEKKIYKVLQNKVNQFYNEPVFDNDPPNKPKMYVRTFTLRDSMKASPIMKSSHGFYFTVGWDNEYLSFSYPSGNNYTGLEILEAFDSSGHGAINGYMVSGSHNYFTEALEELGGETGIKKIFRENLILVGVPII